METILLLLAEARPGSAHPPGEWLVSIRQVRAVAMTTVPPPSNEIPSAKVDTFSKMFRFKSWKCAEISGFHPPVSPRRSKSFLLQRNTLPSHSLPSTGKRRSPVVPFNRLALLPLTEIHHFICIWLRLVSISEIHSNSIEFSNETFKVILN